MNKLTEKFSGKRFFFVTLIVVGFFIFLLLDWFIYHLYKDIDSIRILIGFFRELLFFPLMFIIQPALLILSFIHCINEKFRIKSYSFCSFLILLISNSFCIGSFFIESFNKWLKTFLIS